MSDLLQTKNLREHLSKSKFGRDQALFLICAILDLDLEELSPIGFQVTVVSATKEGLPSSSTAISMPDYFPADLVEELLTKSLQHNLENEFEELRGTKQ